MATNFWHDWQKIAMRLRDNLPVVVLILVVVRLLGVTPSRRDCVIILVFVAIGIQNSEIAMYALICVSSLVFYNYWTQMCDLYYSCMSNFGNLLEKLAQLNMTIFHQVDPHPAQEPVSDAEEVASSPVLPLMNSQDHSEILKLLLEEYGEERILNDLGYSIPDESTQLAAMKSKLHLISPDDLQLPVCGVKVEADKKIENNTNVEKLKCLQKESDEKISSKSDKPIAQFDSSFEQSQSLEKLSSPLEPPHEIVTPEPSCAPEPSCEGSHCCATKVVECKNSIDEELKCSICRETYRIPIALRCGHTFCQGCLVVSMKCTIQDDNGNWTNKLPTCPNCRFEIHPLSFSANPNITVQNIVDSQRKAGCSPPVTPHVSSDEEKRGLDVVTKWVSIHKNPRDDSFENSLVHPDNFEWPSMSPTTVEYNAPISARRSFSPIQLELPIPHGVRQSASLSVPRSPRSVEQSFSRSRAHPASPSASSSFEMPNSEDITFNYDNGTLEYTQKPREI